MAKKAKKRGTGRLILNNYGKSRVRLTKVTRKGPRHSIREISVDVSLEGDFDAVHTRGDNRKCLPTDTMKNTVYVLGHKHPIGTIEEFAIDLARHFVGKHEPVEAATVSVAETAWDRAMVRGRPHPHCFLKGSGEMQVCEVMLDEGGMSVIGGLDGLVILKSADSAFDRYLKDEFTTLAETRDRIFATSVSARWLFAEGRRAGPRFGEARRKIRTAMIETFADHKSESVQHTLHAMGQAAIDTCKEIESVRLSLPNQHCLLVDLAKFGRANRNEVFVPTDEPYGLIEATVARG